MKTKTINTEKINILTWAFSILFLILGFAFAIITYENGAYYFKAIFTNTYTTDMFIEMVKNYGTDLGEWFSVKKDILYFGDMKEADIYMSFMNNFWSPIASLLIAIGMYIKSTGSFFERIKKVLAFSLYLAFILNAHIIFSYLMDLTEYLKSNEEFQNFIALVLGFFEQIL